MSALDTEGINNIILRYGQFMLNLHVNSIPNYNMRWQLQLPGGFLSKQLDPYHKNTH